MTAGSAGGVKEAPRRRRGCLDAAEHPARLEHRAGLQGCLSHAETHALRQAGAPTLMTTDVIAAICDHAQGNPRALMIMAAELLEATAQREARRIDETLFFEICAVPATSEAKAATRRRR